MQELIRRFAELEERAAAFDVPAEFHQVIAEMVAIESLLQHRETIDG